MSELQTIHSALERAAQRRRLDNALRGFWRGLLAGAVIWLLALAAYKLFPIPISSLAIAGVASIACLFIGAVAGGWRRPSVQEIARWVDVKQNLKERLSTAIEVETSSLAGEWKNLLMSDAAEHVRSLDPRRLLPLHLPRVTRWALLVLLLGAGLGFVPEYRSKQYLQKQADAANIKETGKQLAELTRRNLDTKPPVLE